MLLASRAAETYADPEPLEINDRILIYDSGELSTINCQLNNRGAKFKSNHVLKSLWKLLACMFEVMTKTHPVATKVQNGI